MRAGTGLEAPIASMRSMAGERSSAAPTRTS